MDYHTDLTGFGVSALQCKAVFGQTRFPSLCTWIDPLKVTILGHVFWYECEEPFVYRLFLSDYVWGSQIMICDLRTTSVYQVNCCKAVTLCLKWNYSHIKFLATDRILFISQWKLVQTGLNVMYCKTAFSESCEIEEHMLLPFLEICLNRDADRGWFASIHKFWSWRKVPIYLTAVRNKILYLATQE